MTEFDQSDRAHVEELAGRIKAAQKHDATPDGLVAPIPDRVALSAGRVGFEFMGAVLAGIGLGWLVDAQFPTAPWGALAGLFAGFVAGIANAWRATMGPNKTLSRPRKRK